MYIISDSAMEKLLGGEFCQVVIANEIDKNISIRKLYNFQFNYFSYQGFRKFYLHKLKPIINKIKYIDNNNMIAKMLLRLYGIDNEQE